MLELLVPGGTIAAVMFALLKHGPRAVGTVLREWTRFWLVRRAFKGKDKDERKRARDLLKFLESEPPNQDRKSDSAGGPDG